MASPTTDAVVALSPWLRDDRLKYVGAPPFFR
jgi:hypothetical protein